MSILHVHSSMMKSMHFFAWLILFTGLIFGPFDFATAASESAVPNVAPTVFGLFDQVVVCHQDPHFYARTEMNTYVISRLFSEQGSTSRHLLLHHTDIIPPFAYDFGEGLRSFGGFNWSDSSVAEYEASCLYNQKPLTRATKSVRLSVGEINNAGSVLIPLSPTVAARLEMGSQEVPVASTTLVEIALLASEETDLFDQEFLKELSTAQDSSDAPTASIDPYANMSAVTLSSEETLLYLETSQMKLLETSPINTERPSPDSLSNLLDSYISVRVFDESGAEVPFLSSPLTLSVFSPALLSNEGPMFGFLRANQTGSWIQQKWQKEGNEFSLSVLGSGAVSLWGIAAQPAAIASAVTPNTKLPLAARIADCQALFIFAFVLSGLLMVVHSLHRQQKILEFVAGEPAMLREFNSNEPARRFIFSVLLAATIFCYGAIILCLSGLV